MKAWIVFIAFLVIPKDGRSQAIEKLKEIKINEPISVSSDRNGNIFLSDRYGNLNKYSSEGELELTYSTPQRGGATLLEAWPTLNVLLFYQDFQSITVLNRFLAPIQELNLNDLVGFARLATFNFQSNIWLIDDSDFMLKLYDRQLGQITISTPLNLILDQNDSDISFIREYQNQLFIADRNNGILIFDNLGNYLKKLPYTGVNSFTFLGNEMHFLMGKKLLIYNIYSQKEQSVEVPTSNFVLSIDGKLYLFQKDKFLIYSNSY
ncbi:MAG: hypothetical protein RJQ09_03580 [Cyclobacteriaceae bacterium]